MELRPLPPASVHSSANVSQTLSVPPPRSGKDKFRALVNKVINRQRACIAIQEVNRGYSLDQGIDPHNQRAEHRFGSQIVKCAIQVTHYSERYCRTTSYDNAGLVELLKGENLPPRKANEVRWINVAGVSWDVVKALAIHFHLHPLSVEDVMAGTHDKSFKVDYYQQHLFAQLTSYKLRQKRNKDAKAAAKKLRANASSVFYFTGRAREHQSSNNVIPVIKTQDLDAVETPIEPPRSLRTQPSTISELGKSALSVVHPPMSTTSSRSSVADAVQVLKLQSGTLDIDTTRLFVFLLKNGTLLSIHQDPTLYGAELLERLNTQSLLRSLVDASMLFHGFLDLVADHLITVVDEYQLTILELERGILLRPTLLAVQSLHLISGDVRLLKMAIKPWQRIVYGLRRYDRDRYKAVAPPGENTAMGFLSEEAIVYLSDIHDHVHFIMLSLDAQSSTTRELIQFTFNLTNYDSRNVMRILLVVTVIFLPLMFITQYFGMNFEVMDSVKLHSDALFWKIVGPVLFTLIAVAVRKRVLEFLFESD